MSNTERLSTQSMRRAIWLGSILVLMMLGGLAIKPANSASTLNTGSKSATTQESSDKGRQLIRVFIHEFDLYPSLVRVRPGKVLLSAENEKRTGVALIVERVSPGQAPQRAARTSVARDLKRAGQELNLGTGEYVFYEESNPKLTGRIVVEPY